MKLYSHFGFNEFIILLGYKGYVIKEYFSNYFLHQSDVTFDLSKNTMEIRKQHCEPWKVTLIDTGLMTQTGGRILRAKPYVGKEAFMLTYGDGVSDVNVQKLLEFHKSHGRTATVTAVQPEGRYGTVIASSDGKIANFAEKPPGDGAWINAGFFVLEPRVFDYLKDGELYSFKHHGFWKAMDTLRDKTQLQEMWDNGDNPWILDKYALRR